MKKKSDLSSIALAKDEVSNYQLLEAIQGIDQRVGSLDQKIGGLDRKIDKNTRLIKENKQLIDGNTQLIKGNCKLINGNSYLINQNKDELLGAINQFSTEVEERFDTVESRLGRLEFNQADMLSKLDNTAPKLEFVDLKERVGVLESK